tara:strand:+ start:464 stop:955 length:492 start_codon:yes stop_codon:yes gene_type:complete
MEQEESDTNKEEQPLHFIRLKWAGAFISVLVATDLFLNFFCASWPLIVYLLIGAWGAWRGKGLHQRFSSDSLGSRFARKLGSGLAIFSAVGLFMLFAMPPQWESKCAWRYCGRALGIGLLQSPFPVGSASCRAWHICANEYPYSEKEYRKILNRIEEQGCAPP